jgi:hypothetical protein
MDKITVIGSSIINHNARSKLGISVNEYVILQFMAGLVEDGMEISEHACISTLGLEMKSVMHIVESLQEKGRLGNETDSGMYYPYEDWWKAHKEKGFEFSLFYAPLKIDDVCLSWRNSNTTATKKKFIPVLKESPIELIIYSKLRYLIGKWETNSLDFIMGAERFLGPDKHWTTKWQLKTIGEEILSEIIARDYYPGSALDLTRLHTDIFPKKINEPSTRQTLNEVNFDD